MYQHLFGQPLLNFLFLLLTFHISLGGDNPDEKVISRFIYVDQISVNTEEDGTSEKPFKTISKALEHWNRQSEVPTRIIIADGVYREAVMIPSFKDRNNTILVIEGKHPGKVVVAGSDEFSPSTWKSLGNGLYSHEWTYNFGNFDGTQGCANPPKLLGHRRELVFINGVPLAQVILEDYYYTPRAAGDYAGQGSWVFKVFLGTTILSDRTFGVVEREDGQIETNKIFIKIPDSIDFSAAKIEVGVRERTFHTDGSKNNLVIRNVVFRHAVTRFESGGSVHFGNDTAGYLLPFHFRNVLMENCRIEHNNDHGLWMIGAINMNLKNVKSNFNGGNGIGCAYIQQGKWEDTETSYNNWRSEDLGGGYAWASAGMKVNWCSKNMTFIRHTAIGNSNIGFWFDGNNYQNTMDGFIINNNKYGVLLEISEGPLTITNSSVTDNILEGICVAESGQVLIRNCTVANNNETQIKFAGKNSGRDRTVPEEYRGPLYAEPQKIGTVGIVNNKIYTKKGKKSYLLTPEYLVWAAEEPTFGNFLKTQLFCDSNQYFNPDNKEVFGVSINNKIKEGKRVTLDDWKAILNKKRSRPRREKNSRWTSLP